MARSITVGLVVLCSSVLYCVCDGFSPSIISHGVSGRALAVTSVARRNTRHTSAIRGFGVSPSASDSRFRALIRLRQTNPGGGPDNKDIEDIDVDEIGEIVSGPPEFVFFLSLGGLALCLQALSKAAAGNSDLGGGMLPQLGNREELLVLGLVSLLLGFQVSQWLSGALNCVVESASVCMCARTSKYVRAFVRPSVFLRVPVSLTHCFVSESISLSVFVSAPASASLYLHLHLSLCIGLCIYSSVCLSVSLSFCLSVYLYVYLSVYQPIDLSVCLSCV